MHSIFAPGFPGLLEAFYVQERLMEYLMPELYQSFVCSRLDQQAKAHTVATQHDFVIGLGDEMVYYLVCQYIPLFSTIANMGRFVVRRKGYNGLDIGCYSLVFQG
jgi:hypothetical protein